MAVNKLTGKIKMGDGHTLLRDLPEFPASVGGEGGGVYRNEKVHVAFDSPGVSDAAGVRIATIQPNEMVREIWFVFDEVFDVGTMKYGTTFETSATFANAGGGGMDLTDTNSPEMAPLFETMTVYLEYAAINVTDEPIDLFFWNIEGPSTAGQMRSNVLIAQLAAKP
jgi:hypothetical protein